MLGSSRSSFAAARDELGRRAGSDGFAGLSDELLAASVAVAGSAALRGALADSGTEQEERVSLVGSVFGDQLGQLAVDVLADIAGRRWTSGADLADAIEALGVEAGFIVAERAGRLDAVEDELFRVERVVSGDESLRRFLTDPAVSAEARVSLLSDLFGGKVDELTLRLVRHVTGHLRGRRLDDALTELVAQSARRRERVLANVRVAAPITAQQEARLTAALARVYGRQIELQVEVDPEVRGGAVVRVGDEVIDGSVNTRIDQIRRRLGVAT
jgi:F-type H+-transporting ATPase subunit delta